MRKAPDPVLEFLSDYPSMVQEIALRLRTLVRSVIPDAQEILDRSARIVGYGFGPGYADLICTIIPSKKGVKLGLARGAQLPDPHELLEGPGKKHRYVAFTNASDLNRTGLQTLLRSAAAAWRNAAVDKA